MNVFNQHDQLKIYMAHILTNLINLHFSMFKLLDEFAQIKINLLTSKLFNGNFQPVISVHSEKLFCIVFYAFG